MPVGFTPRNGARIQWVVPGPNSGFPPSTDTFLNTAAGDPFGTGEGGTLDLAVFRARYGTPPVNDAGTEGVFKVYAESIGSLSTAMHNAAKDPGNPWGLTPSGNGHATQLEVHDFAATECPQGRNSAIFAKYFGDGGGGISTVPGQPAINTISSPKPGQIHVTWQTRTGHTAFKITAESPAASVAQTVEGTLRDCLIETPQGVGGQFSVTVTAFIGSTPGKPSLHKTVAVQAATDAPSPPVDQPPVDPPTDPPVVEPPPTPVATPVPKPPPSPLSSDAHITVSLMTTWFNPARNPGKAGRLQRLADELRERGLVS